MDDRNFSELDAKEWMRAVEDPTARARHSDIYPLLNKWVNDNNPIRILDIGCGQGVCSAAIDLENRNYIGVDPSPVLVQRAKELYSSVNRDFRVGNAYQIPFEENNFDAVFSVALFHLLENLNSAMDECSRVLRPKGSLLIIMPDPDLYSAWTAGYQHSQQIGKRFQGTHQRYGQSVTDVFYLHTFPEIKNALQSTGLTVQNTQNFRNQIAIFACHQHDGSMGDGL